MKTWMKCLLWLGIGGGIGFFSGLQVGNKRASSTETEHFEAVYDNGYNAGYAKAVEDNKNAYFEIYRGGDGDSAMVVPEEDPPMPEEPVEIGDEEEIEIPELHPQHMIPEQINEDEYYTNIWNYDQESLIYYELDEVLFNKDTRKAIKDKDSQDQVIGIGMLFNFYLKDGEALDAIFVKNDTMGVIFRIDRVEAAYMDEINGAEAPEYEEEDLD